MQINSDSLIVFSNDVLTICFQDYHREKAILRVVRKEFNSRRSHQGRLREMKKDLQIRNKKTND
jgi:hypothetical protein